MNPQVRGQWGQGEMHRRRWGHILIRRGYEGYWERVSGGDRRDKATGRRDGRNRGYGWIKWGQVGWLGVRSEKKRSSGEDRKGEGEHGW